MIASSRRRISSSRFRRSFVTSSPSTGFAPLYQLMLSRSSPRAYSNLRARSFSRAARVRFANIGLDAADRRIQLGRNLDGDDLGLEFCSVCKRILNEGFGDLMRAHPVERVVRIVDGYGDVMCHASKMNRSPRRSSPDPTA